MRSLCRTVVTCVAEASISPFFFLWNKVKHKPVLLIISMICSDHTKKDKKEFAVKEKQKKGNKFIHGCLLNRETILHSQGVYELEKYSEILDFAFSICFSHSSVCISS